jgi:hypothetical protein
MNELKKDEVADRLDVSDPDTVAQLYRLGETMLKENNDRASALDGKATNMLGYAGVILAFLLAHSTEWTTEIGRVGKFFLLIAAVSGLAAAYHAFQSFLTRDWRWFSEKEWFKETAIGDANRLRRFHILAMHAVNQTNSEINRGKAGHVSDAQWWVAVATGSLALTLGVHILGSWL